GRIPSQRLEGLQETKIHSALPSAGDCICRSDFVLDQRSSSRSGESQVKDLRVCRKQKSTVRCQAQGIVFAEVILFSINAVHPDRKNPKSKTLRIAKHGNLKCSFRPYEDSYQF
ncbi:hypothetical protein, partial [Gelidibacter japonicus]|uniref:hypothetical protein n=1 Tax=Gelidibacter japonicus TaxID=1962232 RepID=UPI002AFE1F6A